MHSLNLIISYIGFATGLTALIVSLVTLRIVLRRLGTAERANVTQHGMYFDQKHGVYVDRPQDVSK